MKKFLIVAVVAIPTLLILGIGSILVAANQANKNCQRPFFEAVASGEPARVLEMLDEELHSEIDAPVLAEWMKAVNEKLGKFQGISPDAFNTKVASKNGTTFITSSVTVLFEHGEATSEIIYAGDKIVGFDIESPRLDGNWFNGLSNWRLYFDKASEFYQQFADKNLDEAYASMHEGLQEELTLEEFTKMQSDVKNMIGDIEKIELLGGTFIESDTQKFQVELRLHGPDGEMTATSDYHFAGLKGVLTGFNMSLVVDATSPAQ